MFSEDLNPGPTGESADAAPALIRPLSIRQLSIGQCASLACILECTAPKPGNVHRGADFEDVTYPDFVISAVAIGPAMERTASGGGVGRAILDAVRATREAVGTNTNLGTVLLLAPLAAVPRDVPLADGIGDVLSRLDAGDARDVYAAIRLARPGGLGTVAASDVSAEPPADLIAAMRLAADRDRVARQYATGFADVLSTVAPWLREGIGQGWTLSDAIVQAFIRSIAAWGDSLIARKCGPEVAARAADQAAAVLAVGGPGDNDYHAALADFDFWLRSDGHRRNPGTTADLIAAGLFVGLREGWIRQPFRLEE
jgi:triphosphoribosyl-dephospho-CoA synthase